MSANPPRFAPPRQAVAIRRGSSLARGLVYDVDPALGIKEQAYRRDMTVTGSLVASEYGLARAQAGTARAFVIPDAVEQRSAAVTLWARVRRTGTVGDYTTIIGKNWQGNTGPTFVSYDLTINPGDAAGQNNVRANKGYSGSVRAVTATHSDTTQWFDAALVIDSTGLYLYLDGVLAASNVVDDPTSAIAYGASGNNDWMTNTGSSTAPLDYARIRQWNRGLTASEMAELSGKTQPLSGFDRSLLTRIDAGAGGAQTLQPPLLTNNQTFYSPTVTGGAAPQILAPSLLTNSQTFYSPTVAVVGFTAAYILANTGPVGANPAGFMYEVAGLVDPDDYMTYTTVSGPTPGGGTLVEYPDGTFEYTGGAPAIWVVQIKINGVDYFETTTVFLYDQEFTLLPPLLVNTQTFYAPTVTGGGSVTQTLTPPLLNNVPVIYAPTVSRVVTPGPPGSAGDKNTPSGMIGFWNR